MITPLVGLNCYVAQSRSPRVRDSGMGLLVQAPPAARADRTRATSGVIAGASGAASILNMHPSRPAPFAIFRMTLGMSCPVAARGAGRLPARLP